MDKEVRSRFSVGMIGLMLFPPLFLLCLVIFFVALIISLDQLSLDIIGRIIPLTLVSLLLIISLVYYSIRNLAAIIIYKDSIRFRFLFKNVRIYWQDIEHISLTGLHHVGTKKSSYTYDAVCIMTKDEKSHDIPYPYYSNYTRLVRLMELVEKQVEQGIFKNIDLSEQPEPTPLYEKPSHIEGTKFSGTIF